MTAMEQNLPFAPRMTPLGHKGGAAKQHTPVEAPDSAASIDYIKMLLALGEGEWEGDITARDIYLNDTPLANSDGTLNFPNVTWEFRSGTVDQDYIKGIPSIDNEVNQGVELTNEIPFVYTATNRELSALRVRLQWPALYQYKNNGDMVGYRMEYAIDLAVGSGGYQTVHNGVIDDKTTSLYSRSVRVDLPAYQEGGWRLRVRRITPEAKNTKIADTMKVAAVAEVIDAKMSYPNTALLYIQFDAATFASTPQISVEAKGRRVRVPSNYNPTSRTYSGTWDGTYIYRYTTNPVWHWLDIVLSRRFGLGRRVDATMVNKWTLYRIAQYCDQMVPDGLGGLEPRFSCNVYLQSQAEAWNVLRDISAIFRGMTYWSGSEMSLDADMPADVVYTFSPSNIVGDFEYTSSPWKERYTLTAVKWDNPANNYKTEVYPVADLKGQARYGIRQADIMAVGCISRSEAARRGKWVNGTSRAETNTVVFSTGVEGRGVAPGKIIAVADPDLAGKALGGRIFTVASTRRITLDRDVENVAVGDTLRVNLPSGKSQERAISAVNGREITVVASFTETPVAEAQWSIERLDLETQKYRVMTIEDQDDGTRKITAIEHNFSKFEAIDNGAKIELPPITSIPGGALPAPETVTVSQNVFTAQGLAVTAMTVVWTPVKGAIKYEVQWRRDNGNWIPAGTSGSTSQDIQSVYAGDYVARVRAISSMDLYSTWTESTLTTLQGKTTPPPVLAALYADSAIFSIALRWAFPAGMPDDIAFTEIQQNIGNVEEGATTVGLFSYPTDTHLIMGMAAGQAFWFRGRLRDRSGNTGEWSPWIRGASSADATEILDYLKGQITESQLGQALLSEIDKIPSIEEQLKDITNTLEYDPTQAYPAYAVVRKDTILWQAIKAVPADADGSLAVSPPNANYWVNVGTVLQNANALAGRMDTVEQRMTDTEAVVNRTERMFAALDPDLTGDSDWYAGDDGIYAGTVTVQSVAASQTEAVATRVTTLQANFQTETARLNAAVMEETIARTNALNALAQRTSTLEATVGTDLDTLRAQVKSTSQAVADVNGKVSASNVMQVAVTANGQQYAAGFALGIDYSGGVTQSSFLVLAQRFAILNGTDAATATAPFVVQNGQVFLNQAFIGTGWITNAMIGNIIQSDTYVPGQQGWAINKSGGFELNGTVPGLGRVQITNNVIQVWYPNGVLACRMGIW